MVPHRRSDGPCSTRLPTALLFLLIVVSALLISTEYRHPFMSTIIFKDVVVPDGQLASDAGPLLRGASHTVDVTTSNSTEVTPIPRLPTSCPRVAVVTTASSPHALNATLAALVQWCILIVPTSSHHDSLWSTYANAHPNVTFLSPKLQASQPFTILDHLPPSYHPSRKSVAYLYAMRLSARIIWDTDDRTEPFPHTHVNLLSSLADAALSGKLSVPLASSSSHRFANPYPYFLPVYTNTTRAATPLWPRGLPHIFASCDAAANLQPSDTSVVPHSSIAVYQTLTNGHADTDALHDAQQASQISFTLSNASIAVAATRLLPLNSHAALWQASAFQEMLLPFSMPAELADVFRGFLAHPLFAARGLHTAVVSPVATRARRQQQRGVRNTASLVDSVVQTGRLQRVTEWLEETRATTGIASMRQLYVGLSEIGTLNNSDVRLCDAWLHDVSRLGYAASTQSESVPLPLPPTTATATATATQRASDVNVAVCVSGQVRTLAMPVDSDMHPGDWFGMKSNMAAPNMTVAESIQRVLYPKLGGHPDVFMVVATRETGREPRVDDVSVCEPLRPPAPAQLKCWVRREVTEAVTKMEVWDKFMLYNYYPAHKRGRVVQGFLQQLKGMYECYREVRKHSIQTGKTYDWVVRMRPDNYMVRVPELHELERDADGVPTVWFGSLDVCCCGNEDRFGIAPARLMEPYMDRFLYLQQVNWTLHGEWVRRFNRTLFNAEMFLDSVMRDHGIVLRQHPGIHMCTVKPKDRTERSQP